MATRFRDFSTEEYWHLTWPFLLTAIAGAILRYASPRAWHPSWLPVDFTSGLADALLIAGILGLLLELFATRLLIENVSDGLADKLVGRGLPAALQSHIHTIVDTGLVRDHFVKVYRLSPIAGSGHLHVEVTIDFEAKNFSDATLDYAPIFQDEVFYDPQLLSLEYGLIGQPRYSETSEEINALTKVKTVKGKQIIKLEPVRRNEKAICEVAMRYRLKMPTDYTDTTDFAGATVGAVLRVETYRQDLKWYLLAKRRPRYTQMATNRGILTARLLRDNTSGSGGFSRRNRNYT